MACDFNDPKREPFIRQIESFCDRMLFRYGWMTVWQYSNMLTFLYYSWGNPQIYYRLIGQEMGDQIANQKNFLAIIGWLMDNHYFQNVSKREMANYIYSKMDEMQDYSVESIEQMLNAERSPKMEEALKVQHWSITGEDHFRARVKKMRRRKVSDSN